MSTRYTIVHNTGGSDGEYFLVEETLVEKLLDALDTIENGTSNRRRFEDAQLFIEMNTVVIGDDDSLFTNASAVVLPVTFTDPVANESWGE